jgi:hypothetical protein
MQACSRVADGLKGAGGQNEAPADATPPDGDAMLLSTLPAKAPSSGPAGSMK